MTQTDLYRTHLEIILVDKSFTLFFFFKCYFPASSVSSSFNVFSLSLSDIWYPMQATPPRSSSSRSWKSSMLWRARKGRCSHDVASWRPAVTQTVRRVSVVLLCPCWTDPVQCWLCLGHVGSALTAELWEILRCSAVIYHPLILSSEILVILYVFLCCW